MRPVFLFLFLGNVFLLSAATPSEACINAGSMIGFVENHVRNALDTEELNLARYHTYKAINTIEKSRSQFDDCACDFARKNIIQSLDNLKMATRVTTMEGTRILLFRAMEDMQAGREALDEHEETHESPYGSDVLALNTVDSPSAGPAFGSMSSKEVEARIDTSLIAYRKSLQEVVEGVPCREALAFVTRIYEHCERQLLREDLTPAKRYYNLRTKEITENALNELRGCSAR